MRREDIQVALEEASRISKQTEFVIAGSLSVLGFIDVPPELMAMSIDIDFYPLRNPGRAGEIAQVLGEDSEFHERHGYYLDPVSPELPVLPGGWRDRLHEVRLGAVTAFFLDVNDTAISKYARGFDNDYRWLDAGFEYSILNLNTIRARARFNTQFPLPEDKAKTTNGIRCHEAALLFNGVLDKDLLAFLRSDPARTLDELDTDAGQYSGKILWRNDRSIVQATSQDRVVIHMAEGWLKSIETDTAPTITYQEGSATLVAKKERRSDIDLGF